MNNPIPPPKETLEHAEGWMEAFFNSPVWFWRLPWGRKIGVIILLGILASVFYFAKVRPMKGKIDRLEDKVESLRHEKETFQAEALQLELLYEPLRQKALELHPDLDAAAAIATLSEEIEAMGNETEFNSTVSQAKNNDRRAWDQLEAWADDPNYQFRERAGQAWVRIFEEHSAPFTRSPSVIPWKEGVDPNALTLDELRDALFHERRSYVQQAMIYFVSERKDLPKREVLEFLIEVMSRAGHLDVVESAGRSFTKIAELRFKPLAVDHFAKWFEENKGDL